MADRRFNYFVIFAEMRTGSNFLEANINQFADLRSHGELFNPYFVGKAKKDEMFGVSLKEREKSPETLISAIREDAPTAIPGFRFFSDHDPRILSKCLNDADCAKIILTRNPLDCYVSRKIAADTGQWRLTNLKHQKTVQVAFDAGEFEEYISAAQGFQVKLLNALQESGQTAFYINYDDIHSLAVLNGLARFIGSSDTLDALDSSVKKQNPSALKSKVSNYSAMVASLGKMDFMGLSRTPNFEPRRGAAVPRICAGDKVSLLIVPVKGGPDAVLKSWLTKHETLRDGQASAGMNQKTLKIWRQDHPGFRVLVVLRHPVERLHHSFCEYILSTKHTAYHDLREAIIHNYRVRLPKNGADAPGYDLATHKAAFLSFMAFVKANIAQQTPLRIDPAWASQTAVIEGVSTVVIPTSIVHERNLANTLAEIEKELKLAAIDPPEIAPDGAPFELSEIYDADIESRARTIYSRDYLNFGFLDWTPLN